MVSETLFPLLLKQNTCLPLETYSFGGRPSAHLGLRSSGESGLQRNRPVLTSVKCRGREARIKDLPLDQSPKLRTSLQPLFVDLRPTNKFVFLSSPLLQIYSGSLDKRLSFSMKVSCSSLVFTYEVSNYRTTGRRWGRPPK